jgi:hypothetical protein
LTDQCGRIVLEEDVLSDAFLIVTVVQNLAAFQLIYTQMTQPSRASAILQQLRMSRCRGS